MVYGPPGSYTHVACLYNPVSAHAKYSRIQGSSFTFSAWNARSPNYFFMCMTTRSTSVLFHKTVDLFKLTLIKFLKFQAESSRNETASEADELEGMAGALARALASRNKAIGANSDASDDDDESDDDWSD